MRSPVDGLMAEAAIRLLGRSPDTHVIVVLAKSASLEAQRRVLRAAMAVHLPLVVDFLSAEGPGLDGEQVIMAETFEAAARQALRLAGVDWGLPPTDDGLHGALASALRRLPPSRRLLRGLYAGGSLCAESARILASHGIMTATNLGGPLSRRPQAHLMLDLGAEEYTAGRAHPFIDPRLREIELAQAFSDPTVGVLLVDVVLGWGCHPDPAGALAVGLRKANPAQGGGPVVIASLCGTPEDPQGFQQQRAKLTEAGVMVLDSNAGAAEFAAEAVDRLGRP
jgi:FdrA protein